MRLKQSVLKFGDMKLEYLDKKNVAQGGGDCEKSLSERFREPLSLAEMENLKS